MPLLERPAPVAHRPSHVRSAGLGDLVVLRESRWHPTVSARREMLVIVVHGPPAAGASTVAANLAIALTQFGTRVVLLDLDVARPTQHRLFGVASPVPGLRALLSGDIETAGEALTATSLKNLFLVASTGVNAVDPSWAVDGPPRLLRQLAELDTDILLVDGARALPAELGLFDSPSVYHLLVTGSDLSSLGTICRFIAGRVRGAVTGLGGPDPGTEPAGTLDELALRLEHLLADAPPEARAHLERQLGGLSFGLIGNGAREERHVGLVHATSRLLNHELRVHTPVLGVLTHSQNLARGDGEGRPLLMSARTDRNSRTVHVMAEILLSEAARAVARASEAPPAAGTRFCWPSPGEAMQALSSRWTALLDTFTRRSPRFEVDWYGTLRLHAQERATAARIFEVSEIGASVEALSPMQEGDTGELRLDQVRGAPTLSVRVQRLHPGLNRAGLSFEGASPELRHALVAIARAHQP